MEENLQPLWDEIHALRTEVLHLSGETLVWRLLTVDLINDSDVRASTAAKRFQMSIDTLTRLLGRKPRELREYHPQSLARASQLLALLRVP